MKEVKGTAGARLYKSSTNLYEDSIFSKMPEGIRPGGLVLTERLVDYCDFPRGAKIADIGCGTGITVEYLSQRGLAATGIDLSAVLLRQGQERRADLQFMQSPGENLPFANHSLAGVLAECSLSVMPDMGRVLAEINRVLVAGGRLAVTDVYFRDGSCRFCGSNGGPMTADEIMELLQEYCFKLIVFEDQSAFLREFVARFILEHGSTEELWQCIGLRQQHRPHKAVGYYLLVAEKGN